MLTQGIFVRETPLRKGDFAKGQGSIMSRKFIKKFVILLMLVCSGIALYALYTSNQNMGINTSWKALVNNMQINEAGVKSPIRHVTFEQAPPRRIKPKKLIVDDYQNHKAYKLRQRTYTEKTIVDSPNYEEAEEEKTYVNQDEYENYKDEPEYEANKDEPEYESNKDEPQYESNNENNDLQIEDKQQNDDVREEGQHRNAENSFRRQELQQEHAHVANVPEEYVVRNQEGRVVEEKLFDGGINHHIVKKLRQGVQKRVQTDEKAEPELANENIEEEKRPENEDLLDNHIQQNNKLIDLNVDLNSDATISIRANNEIERENFGGQKQHEHVGVNQHLDERPGRAEANNLDAFGLENKHDDNDKSFQNNEFVAERRNDEMLMPFGVAATDPNIGVQLGGRRENHLEAGRINVEGLQDLQDKFIGGKDGQEEKEKYIPYVVRNGLVKQNRTLDVDNINAGQLMGRNYLPDNPNDKKKYISYLERNGMGNVDQNKNVGVTTKWLNPQDNLLNQESGIEQNVNPGRKDEKMKEILSKLPPKVLASLIKNQQVKLDQMKQPQQFDQVAQRQVEANPQQLQLQREFDQRRKQAEQQREQQIEQQVEQPIEQQREQQVEQQQEQPVEQQIEQREQPVEQRIEQQREQPVEQQIEQQREQPVEQQIEQREQPVEQQIEQREQPVEQRIEQQREQPVEQQIEQQGDQQLQNSGAKEQASLQREKLLVEDLLKPLHAPATCVPFKFLTGSAQVCIHTGDRDPEVSAKIQVDGFYEKEMMDQFYEILMQDSELGVVDVGANIGVYSIAAALLNHQVVAVEPLYRNYRLLHKSAQENQVASKITLVTQGLDNESYVGQMYYSNDGGYSNVTIVKLTRDMKQDRANIVHVTTLDNLLQVVPFSRALLKLDASGGMEERILKAGGTFFKTLTVPYILTHWSVSTNRENYFAMASELIGLGYQPKLAWNGAEVNSEFLQNDRSFLVWSKQT